MGIKSVFMGAILMLFGVSASAADFRVGLVLDRGGKDDKSFNEAAYHGAMKAKGELKVYVKYVEAGDANAYEPSLRAFAQREYDLVIAIGVAQAESVRKIAAQFPKSHFAIVDADVKAPNVRSLMFEEHEGSYLVGAIAAMTSKTGTIGFVGGMDIPLIRRFELGYRAGARKINPKLKVLANYVGVTDDAWNNPAKAKELGISQYESGADVVFAAAGASNGGVFDAAEEKKKLAIGCDSNQDWVKPGFILTSMLKHVDVAVYQTIMDAQRGAFTSGIAEFGLKNGGVDFSVDKDNEHLLSSEARSRADDFKRAIVAGKIQVPDYYRQTPTVSKAQ